MVNHLVVGNTEQPGRKRNTPPLERRDSLDGIEKDLLSYILSLHPISYSESYIAINLIEIRFIQLGKSLFVALLCLANKAFFILHLTTPRRLTGNDGVILCTKYNEIDEKKIVYKSNSIKCVTIILRLKDLFKG